MNRRDFVRLSGLATLGAFVFPKNVFAQNQLRGSDFGPDFRWGVSIASFQNEGAWLADGKGLSIWDTFSHKKGKIKDNSTAEISCDFYNRYPTDLKILKQLNLNTFRFSIAWPRILPNGFGAVNRKGIDFYNALIDECLALGIEPWVTAYHWDLPQALQDKGGWTNRDIVGKFSDYCEIISKNFSDRVKYWMVLNEPLAFTGVGYMWGIHAPGKRGFKNFYPAIHHAALAQAEGARALRTFAPQAKIGTTFSCSPIHAKNNKSKHVQAATRLDAFFNRLFVEPAAGLGYPFQALPALENLNKYIKGNDTEKLKYNFDFIGIQNYFRVVARSLKIVPMLHAFQVSPKKRNVPITTMGTEIFPQGMYEMLHQFNKYNFPEIFVTENGVPGNDVVQGGRVHDQYRIDYIYSYIQSMYKAKKEGVPVNGYFVWTFLDNFEWAEGFKPRMGLVYVDFKTQERIIKESGYWLAQFIKS